MCCLVWVVGGGLCVTPAVFSKFSRYTIGFCWCFNLLFCYFCFIIRQILQGFPFRLYYLVEGYGNLALFDIYR